MDYVSRMKKNFKKRKLYLADANTSVPPRTKFKWKSIDGSKSKCKFIQNLDEKSNQLRPANNSDLIKSDCDAFSDCGNTSMLRSTNNSSDDDLIKRDYDAFSDFGNTSILCPTNNSSDDESSINESINCSSSSTTVSYICVMQSHLITNKHDLVHRFLLLLWKLLLFLPVFLFCNKVQHSLFCQS